MGVDVAAYSRTSPRLHWLLAIRNSSLRPAPRLVAYAVSAFMDSEGVCYPSQAALVAATGLGRRTVQRELHELHRAGWLHRRGEMKSRRGGRAIAVWEGRVPLSYVDFPPDVQ